MTADSIFDDIRPLRDAEVKATVAQLVEDERFRKSVTPILPNITWEQFKAAFLSVNTIFEFQKNIISPIVHRLIDKTTQELTGNNWEKANDGKPHLIISNHRDIVLDSGFLNILMFKNGMPTTEIAIGDNLLIYEWIRNVVRLNKSFVVKRGVSVRQMLETSKHLSDYIHYTICQNHQPIWLAQREGRAKDSDDKTQTSLLKMLTLHDSSQPLEMLRELNILPLSLSYELDPCDYLKAKEFQLKRDNPEHKKSQADDLENMMTGIMGYKGRVHLTFGNEINSKLNSLDPDLDKNAVIDSVAQLIDNEIYRNYVLFPFNYIAYDKMTQSNTCSHHYSEEDIQKFDAYIDGQIAKIDIPNKDYNFLHERILTMYGNPVKNHLLATK